MEIRTVCCDTLEFDVQLYNENGTPFVLDAGDKLWFAVKKNYHELNPVIYAEQHSTHFEFSTLTPEVKSGIYLFEIGIIFANGKVKTVVNDGKLYVENKLKGHSYE